MPVGWNDTQKLLAFVLVGGFIVIVVLLIFHPLDAQNPTTSMINTLVGVMGTMATGVATYYFGSSKGSSDKDQTISAMASGTNSGTPAAITAAAEKAAPPAANVAAPPAAEIAVEHALAERDAEHKP